MNWVGLREDYMDYQGFVYKITNLKTGQYYIGKKFFHKKKTLLPLKGKTRKRHSTVESNWKDYYGSSAWLLEDIETLGKESFKREILHHCKNKFDCAYFELKEQMNNEVLFDNMSYNGIINVRLGVKKTNLR